MRVIDNFIRDRLPLPRWKQRSGLSRLSRQGAEFVPGFRVRFLWSWLVAVVIAHGWGNTLLAAENVWSVQKLNDNKPWDKFVDSPIAIHVEGRIGSFGGGQLRLSRCDAKFIVDNAKLRSISPKATIELKGRFRKEAGKLEFIVDDLKVVQGYAEQFESRMSKLTRATANEWRELGEWIDRISRFYGDEELTKKANLAFAKSVEVEYESLKPTDAEGRFSLAQKIIDWKLPERRHRELIHEGLRIQWQVLQKAEPANPAAWGKFASILTEKLTGTTEPLAKIPANLQEVYEQDPVATYRKANDDLRAQLHRLFFVAVTRKRLLYGAKSDGRNGDAIADEIEQQIPEELLQAQRQRELQLIYRVAHVATAPRSEVENLSAALRDRGKLDQAQQVLIEWIKSHELRLKGDGVVGLLQLADEYLGLLGNESVAVEYLRDAYRLDPTYDEVKTKLTSLGYQWQNSRWQKATPGKPLNVVPGPQSPAGIQFGMTATDLRTMMGGPDTLTRAITSRGITEVWSYGPIGGSRLVVRLEQKGRDADPKVTAVANPK